MKPEQYARLKELLLKTAGLGPDERRAFLDAACGDDAELRREAEAMLGHEHGTHRLLDPELLLKPVLAPGTAPVSLVGGSISHYRVTALLGSGGMGDVYRADDTHLGRPVALKFPHPDIMERGEFKARFVREARAAAALNHPNICGIHEIGEWEGRLFIAMPLIEGETLRDRVLRGPLPIEEAAGIALRIALGLEAAHARGIVHRDIKPANIMLSGEGRVLILDFGLARPPADAGSGPAGAITGTVAYMSPEQARGDALDPRTDIWSLGVVLYEMVVGALPFRGDSDHAVLRSILTDAPPRLRDMCPGVSDDIQEVIDGALARDRNRRLADAGELVRALAPLAGGPADVPSTPSPARPSVAVLPFANLSGNPDDEYISDGLAEELTNALGQIRGLKVIARTSSFSFKGRQQDVREIGRDLGVDALVEGSMRLSGRRLRVTARLVNAADGAQRWSETYDRDFDDIFAVQEEIALGIVRQLKPKLVAGEGEKLRKRAASDAETYRLYLTGIFHNRKGGQAGLRTAFDHYRQAVARDPGFALAYASLSVAQNDWVTRGYPADAAGFDESRENALCAVELDEECARAHVALGVVKRVYEWDWSGSEREFRRALELNPGEPAAHSEYAALLAILGRGDEAVREARLGAELEPVALNYLTPVGSILWTVRRYDEAIAELLKITAIDASWGQAHYYLARSYAAKGRYAEAFGAIDRLFQLWGRHSRCVGMLALVEAAAGRREEARANLRELVELAAKEPVSPYSIALVHAQLGDIDSAFEHLSRVVTERPQWWPFPKTDSMLDGLRSDARWPRLLEKMGLGE